MPRLNALIYNWWSPYARMVDPRVRQKASTCRPLMAGSVAWMTRKTRQMTFVLTVGDGAKATFRQSFAEMARFLRELQAAPQLTGA